MKAKIDNWQATIEMYIKAGKQFDLLRCEITDPGKALQ